MATKNVVIPIPLNTDGMSGSVNPSTIAPTESIDARNLTYFYGTQRKEGGTTKYNASAVTGAPRILAGCDWWPTPGVQRMVIVTDDGKIYKDSGGGTFATTLKSGLSMADMSAPVFVACGKETISADRLLAVFLGPNNQVQILAADGATTADITTPPADWAGANHPRCGCIAQGRLWGFSGHLAYYSNINSHQSFSLTANDLTGTIPIFPGEGEYILAACSWYTFIVVWKYPVGVYLLDVSDPVPFGWTPRRLSVNVGIDSTAAWGVADNDVYFTWHGEPYAVSQLGETANIRSANLGVTHSLGPWVANNHNHARHGEIQAVYFANRREFMWALAGTGNTKNNLRLVMDGNRADMPRFRYSDLVTCESLWLRTTDDGHVKVMAGDNVGFIRELDVDARSVDGTDGYPSRVQTPYDDFLRMANPYLGTYGIQTRRKNGQFLEVVMEPKGNWSVSADYFWDGVYQGTVQYNMGVDGAGLDSFVLDTDALAGESVANKKKRIIGSGRRFSVAFYNSAANQDFSLAAAFLEVTLGSDRPGTTT